jgi:hypothetical protein
LQNFGEGQGGRWASKKVVARVFRTYLRRKPVGHSLVSLVSALARNWRYLCGRIERVETGEIVEIANNHARFMHVAENTVGWLKSRGEYPTLSATAFTFLFTMLVSSMMSALKLGKTVLLSQA